MAVSKFNERYTLYLDTAGQPVQRTLAEMTCEEVLQAIGWHTEAAAQAEREIKPFEAMVGAFEAGTRDPNYEPPAVLKAAGLAYERAGRARVKLGQLLAQIDIALAPYSNCPPKLNQAELVRRYWP
jgi:hypothetical protein